MVMTKFKAFRVRHKNRLKRAKNNLRRNRLYKPALKVLILAGILVMLQDKGLIWVIILIEFIME